MPLRSNLHYVCCIAAAIVLYVALPDISSLTPSSSSNFRGLNTSKESEEGQAKVNANNAGVKTASSPSIDENRKGRPVIYTFYEHISPESKTTGMSDSADNRMLELWRQSWTDAGWEARVLSLDDAKHHSLYETYSSQLERVSLGPRPSYDRLCYLRWLAMAAAGGGFMADFDVFPLRGKATAEAATDLPSNGKFTVYQMTQRGNAVPGMASGSAAEWERMARLLLEEGLRHESDAHRKRPKIWSDMKSLIGVKGTAGYEIRDGIVKGQDIKMAASVVSPLECKMLAKRWAVHISHKAMEVLGERYEARPQIAQTWLETYSRSCSTPGSSGLVPVDDSETSSSHS